MADVDWPGDLPLYFLVDGYQKSAKELTQESQMDKGPPKVTRIISNNIEVVAAAMVVTRTQLASFKAFLYQTLLGGSIRFNHLDADDGTTAVEMMIRAASWAPLKNSANHWRIDMTIWIMP